MLKTIDFDINDLATDYDTLENRYFEVFKSVHENLNMTIEEFRGSNIYNIINTCILVDMVNNQFLSNFIPQIVENSITQNEIQDIKYSGNTSFFLIQQLKKLSSISNVQIIDINNDLAGTEKGNVRIFIKRANEQEEVNPEEVGLIIYNNLNEGVVSLGDKSVNINKDGFIKNIQYSYTTDVPITLDVVATPNNSWNGDLYTNTGLINLIYEYWLSYYEMQKTIQPQVFLRRLEMLSDIRFTVNYNGEHTGDFEVKNGGFLVLDIKDITLTIG